MNTILFMITGFPIGGAEIFLINLLNKFRTKINPIVISLGAGNDSLKRLHPEVNVIEFKRKWRYDLSIITQIKSIIEKNDIDCAFVIEYFPYFFLRGAVKQNIKPVKVFISLHSTKPKSLKEYIQGYIYSRLLGDKEKLITVCYNQVSYLSKLYRIPLVKFDTIYNGVDTNYFKLAPEDFNRKHFRESLQIPENASVIIQVAAFRKEKKHEDSLRALKIIHTNYNLKPYLLFVGCGNVDIEKKIKRLTQKYNLSEYVKFCGKQDDVMPFYWSSDLFTLSSISIETFSIAALEAMACGLPCVLTNIGGANEMIFDGINGYLIAPNKPNYLADAWMKILNNDGIFNAKNIRQIIIEKFSLETSLNKYAKLLGVE